MPLSRATTNRVVKILLDNVIPQFGLIENTDLDNGSHFKANIIRELTRALDIKWEYHTMAPPSLGKVERMNQALRRHLTKLVLETKLPWTKCLPLSLLRIRMAPGRTQKSFLMKCYMVYLIWANPLSSPLLKPKINFSEIMCSVSLQLYYPSGNRDSWPRLHCSNFQCIHTPTRRLHPDLDLEWRET
jgi:hypothetical protein